MFSFIKELKTKLYVILLSALSVLSGILIWRANSLKTEAEEEAKEAKEELLGYETTHTKEVLKANLDKEKTEQKVQEKVQTDLSNIETEVSSEYVDIEEKLNQDKEFKIKL